MKNISIYLKKIPVYTLVAGAFFTSNMISSSSGHYGHIVPALLFLLFTCLLELVRVFYRDLTDDASRKLDRKRRVLVATYMLLSILFYYGSYLFGVVFQRMVAQSTYYDYFWSIVAIFCFVFIFFPLVTKVTSSSK